MAHPEYGVIVLDITGAFKDDKKLADFQKFMDDWQTAHNESCAKLAVELGVSDACAVDVEYLRSRSRWTQALEDQLIALHKSGKPPNILEFGNI